MNVVIGIDAGTTGAVSFLRSSGAVSVHDLPVVAVLVGEEQRMKIDAYALAALIRVECPVDFAPPVAYIEQLHARAAQGGKEARSGMTQQGVMMETFGALIATLQILRVRTVRVSPQGWKNFYKLKRNKTLPENEIDRDYKTQSRELAMRLYPESQAYFSRVKDHNRAESLLLAHYGQIKEMK